MKYSGWTNKETWSACLWLLNDEHLYRTTAREIDSDTKVAEYADYLKEVMSDELPDLGSSFAADLLQSAFSEINWIEIAESFLEDFQKEESK